MGISGTSESRKWKLLKEVEAGPAWADETDWAGTNTVPPSELTESGAPYKRARSAEDSETVEVLVVGLDTNGALVDRAAPTTITLTPFEVVQGKQIHDTPKPFTAETTIDDRTSVTTTLNAREVIRMRGSPRWGVRHTAVTVPAAVTKLVFLWRPS